MTGDWEGERVLITGHTGFKGTWLALLLRHLGAEVTGLALDAPTSPSLFQQVRLAELVNSLHGDVTEPAVVKEAIEQAAPTMVLHLAAQSLVRAGYDDPVDTYRTNVVGTAVVLDAVRRAPSVRATVVVTSDKCYRNREWPWPYREGDRLGGVDPYSSSKAGAELVAEAFRCSYGDDLGLLATARAGNVIGGGDWAVDRIVPDLVRSALANVATSVRRPESVRPWQHVLDCLHGYVWLARRLADGDGDAAGAWNFGPLEDDVKPVGWVADAFCERWPGARWLHQPDGGPHEAALLRLDSSLARAAGWRPALDLSEAMDWVVAWHRDVDGGADPRAITERQLADYLARQAA